MNKHTFSGICRYLFRSVTRATLKSFLVILVAFSIFLTLGWLQETIDRNEQEITRLFETTYVFGQILPGDAYTVVRQQMGSGYIRHFLADMITIIADDLVADVYYEAAMPWAFITDLDIALATGQQIDAEATTLDDVLNEMISETFNVDGLRFLMEYHTEWLHQITAVSCIDLFIDRNTPTTGILDVEMAGLSLEVEFAPGLDETAFVYTDPLVRAPIPVILSEEMMIQNDFAFGDLIAINFYDLNYEHPHWERLEGEIIGMYQSHIPMQETIFLPFSAWNRVMRLRGELYLTKLEFLVDPMLNRIADTVPQNARVILESVVRNVTPGLILDMHEAQLRFVVQTMEENVSLLWLLYPVVIIVSLLIAGAAAFFLTLQNAKNIAMMRIFGITQRKASLIVWFEQIILCLIGLTIGLALLSVLGWGFGFIELLQIAGLYLGSVIVGSVVGIIIIVRQAPLELLQVRE